MEKNANTSPFKMVTSMVALFVMGIGLTMLSTRTGKNKQLPVSLREDCVRWPLRDRLFPGRQLMTNACERRSEPLRQSYLLNDRNHPFLIRRHGESPNKTTEGYRNAPYLYRGVPGPIEYYPRRLYYFIELGPKAIPIVLEHPLEEHIQEHAVRR